jgi:predicted Rossmann fold flavoprotein
MNKENNIVVIGAGAAGFFAAIQCALTLKEQSIDGRVFLLESHKAYLRKVKISGGGRCNVTHNEFNSTLFCENYPRGKRELRSPFQTFQALDIIKWFEERGVEIVAEDDGRMFPKTNSSETIITCFRNEAIKLGVEIVTSAGVESIKVKENGEFEVNHRQGTLLASNLLLATGSDSRGHTLARSLGHTITDLAPSLFTFKIEHPLFKELSGTTFKDVEIKIDFDNKKKYVSRGPALITHWGLSGPAVLKLSSLAAREMKACSYQRKIFINFSPYLKEEVLKIDFLRLKNNESSLIKNKYPNYLTKSFWINFIEHIGINQDKKWNELSLKDVNRMTTTLFRFELHINGQNRFKEEFVECGGVKLSEVSFKTMESKVQKGLFFAGEVLDIDGVTGGFNFQNAWTTGYIAGTNLALMNS